MGNKIVRPPLVGFLRWVLISYAVGNLYFAQWALSPRAAFDGKLSSLIYSLALTILFFVAAFAIAKGKNWGRWLAVVSFVIDATGISHPYDLYDIIEEFDVLGLVVTVVWGIMDLTAASYLTFSIPVNFFFAPHVPGTWKFIPQSSFDDMADDAVDGVVEDLVGPLGDD